MSRVRTFLRVIVLTVVALAVTSVPVVRAFAQTIPIHRAPAIVPVGAGGPAAHLTCRLPRMRRPKQSHFDVLRESGPSLPVIAMTRHLVPALEQPMCAASFVVLPDHPPA